MMKTRWPIDDSGIYVDSDSEVGAVVGPVQVDGSTLRIPIIHSDYYHCFNLGEFFGEFPDDSAGAKLRDVNLVFEGVQSYKILYQLNLTPWRRPSASHWCEKVVEEKVSAQHLDGVEHTMLWLTKPTRFWDDVTFYIDAQTLELEIPDGDIAAHLTTEEFVLSDYHQRPTTWDRFKAIFEEPPFP